MQPKQQRDDRIRRVSRYHVGCQARQGWRSRPSLQPRGDLFGRDPRRYAESLTEQTTATDEDTPEWRERSGGDFFARPGWNCRWEVVC